MSGLRLRSKVRANYFTELVLPSKSRENIPFGVAENRSVGQ